MVEDSIDDVGLNGNEQTTYRKMKRLIRMCGGQCDWSERRLLAHLGMKETTFSSHRRRLEAVGLIVVTRRRRFGCRQNDTNIYRLKEGGSKIEPQKSSEKTLKTNAPARENPRAAWEARREQDRKDHERKSAEYAAVGVAIRRRLERSRHRTLERAYRAAVGTQEAWNRIYDGQSWEERNAETIAWMEREEARLRAKSEVLNGSEIKAEGAPTAVEGANFAELVGCGQGDFAGVRGEAGGHPCRFRRSSSRSDL